MEQIKIFQRKELDYRTNEAYKTLRTNIQFCGNDIKVITITSCTPNEGKSSISFNLAVSFAEAGKKVILVDADLRKSVLVGRYKFGEVTCGLSHYLSGQKELGDILFSTAVPNMDIIFAGNYSPNPAELLNHNRFQDMLSILREVYDYVIIDTPPLGAVIDSALVAKVSDGAVIVVEAGEISYKYAQYIKEQLEKSNCKILGAIINKISVERNGYYRKYYGKNYYRYYGKYYGHSEND